MKQHFNNLAIISNVERDTKCFVAASDFVFFSFCQIQLLLNAYCSGESIQFVTVG